MELGKEQNILSGLIEYYVSETSALDDVRVARHLTLSILIS